MAKDIYTYTLAVLEKISKEINYCDDKIAQAEVSYNEVINSGDEDLIQDTINDDLWWNARRSGLKEAKEIILKQYALSL